MRDPHVADSQWSRLWHLTLSGSDRRRIMEAVLAGRVMEDRGEALLATELARQPLTAKRRRPPAVLDQDIGSRCAPPCGHGCLARRWRVLGRLSIAGCIWPPSSHTLNSASINARHASP